MATNAEPVVDDDKEVTADDLRDLKYPTDDVETSEEEDETSEGDETQEETEGTSEEDGQTDNQTTDDSEEDDTMDSGEEDSEFVKEFSNIKGDTVEDYARNLERAYGESFKELKRIREASTTQKEPEVGDSSPDEVDVSNPVSLYMKQKMDEEITTAYGEFSKTYPQVQDPQEYDKFTKEVDTLSRTILQSQKRLAPPKELYSKAAVILGWEASNKVTDKDRLGNALRNQASVSKTTSSTKKASKSKVSDQMVAANRLMYPEKTDAQIREELEPYVT